MVALKQRQRLPFLRLIASLLQLKFQRFGLPEQF